MLHRQRALYVLPIWFGNRVLLALIIFTLYKFQLLLLLIGLAVKKYFWYEDKKRYRLISKKHLSDALPVLSNIQV